MKKYPIGFNTKSKEKTYTDTAIASLSETKEPRKSVVRVYFPHRDTGWMYYNDRFDLKVGDFVYVEGKLEGYRGRVTEVNYSFKIKLSDYKKVVAVIDTDVTGDLYLAGTHVVSFDKKAIPFSKVLAWFKAPESDDEYVSGNDDTTCFSIDDLSKIKIPHDAAERGYDYYTENRIGFVEVDGTQVHAVAEGSEIYEIEFNYTDGEISNLKCSCFCGGICKHEFAALLQLKETLDIITEFYQDEYNGYFAAISQDILMNTVTNKKVFGKISLWG